MNLKNNKKILLILFAILLSGNLLFGYYKNQIRELNRYSFPSSGDGFSIFDGMKIKDSKDFSIKTNVVLELTPGQEYNGLIAIKNHRSHDRRFSIVSDSFKPKEENLKIEDILMPKLVFSDLNIVISADDVAFIDYKILIPKDTKPGEYTAAIKTTVIDESADKINSGNLKLGVAAGSKIKVKVLEKASTVQYEKRSDIIAKEANIRIVNLIRWIASFFLIFLTCYFIYQAFRKK